MDILAHSLWTNAIYKKVQKRKRTWKEIVEIIFWSNFPDFFSFGIIFFLNLFTLQSLWRGEDYYIAHLPQWFYFLHGVLYSLPIYFLVFAVVWTMRRKPYWPMGGWFIHIMIDIFTHKMFFPPRFLWPFSDFHLELISWANPTFMILNYAVLIIVYLLFRQRKKPV